ncbi:MAG: site-2 protease family protein, partial [Pseudomonadota bacterium]
MKFNRKYSTAIVLTLKSTKIIKAIKVLKLLKFAKPLITMISIAISVFAYSVAYSISLAITIVALMFVHELGHVIAINRVGFKAGRMVFIPFVGAMISAPKGMDRRQEAIIGIGGPWLGSL